MIKSTKLKQLLELPFLFSALVCAAAVILLEGSILKDTGILMYPLDDPFIHMQIAKNLALNGTWGINAGEFASASSSLFYTILLAILFKLFSVHLIIPFLINCIAAFFLLFEMDKWLKKGAISVSGRTAILLLLVFFIPLPVMILSGMEHTLQCLFCFLFITRLAEWLDVESAGYSKSWPIDILIYGFLVVSIRYEGLFMVAVGCLFALRKKISFAFVLGAVSILPIAIFGLYSLSAGSYFLPNSVLVKSASAPAGLKGILAFFSDIFIYKFTVVKDQSPSPATPPPGISLLATQRLLLLLPLTYFLFPKVWKINKNWLFILGIILGTLILHLALASTGWFYRYEAYLIAISLILFFAVSSKVWKTKPGFNKYFYWVCALVLAFALFLPFVLRSTAAFSKAKQASVNIYEQQYQMARFIHEYHDTSVVAANDIGAISFFSNIRTVDLWGLGSIEIARSKKNGQWSPHFLDNLVREKNVELAIVYETWFEPALFQNWTKIATWKVENNVILGGDKVSFYVVDPRRGSAVYKNLRAFEARLPKSIKVEYPIHPVTDTRLRNSKD